MQSLGRLLYGVGFAVLGLLSLIFADFALNWQPVPADWPHHRLLAYLSGSILILGGIGTLLNRKSVQALLFAFILLWLLALQIPRVMHQPGEAANWLGVGENLMNVVGGFLLISSSSESARRLGQILFGLALIPVGWSHFKYLDFTASMVPAWAPNHHAIALLTGSAHIAAGVAILIGVFGRLASTLEALMITGFVILLHIPNVLKAPADRLQWTSLAIATALAGSAWLVAGTCWTKSRVVKKIPPVERVVPTR